MMSNFQASTLFHNRNTSWSPIFAGLIDLNIHSNVTCCYRGLYHCGISVGGLSITANELNINLLSHKADVN